MTRPLKERANLVEAREEHWKPPIYRTSTGALTELRARLLRFFHFQSGTIWDDCPWSCRRSQAPWSTSAAASSPTGSCSAAASSTSGLTTPTRATTSASRRRTPSTTREIAWPLEAEVADFILCTETLEHIATPDIFLGEMFRCLKPGGRALLTVPFAARWDFIPYDFSRPTPSGLDNIFRKAGFTKVGVYGRGNTLTIACYKGMAFIYSLLSPTRNRAAGSPRSPACSASSASRRWWPWRVLANATLGKQGSVDFLGFTISVERPA